MADRVIEELDEAEPELRKAVALQSDFYEAHINLGDVLHRRGRVQVAIERVRILSELHEQRMVVRHVGDHEYALDREAARRGHIVGCARKSPLLTGHYPNAFSHCV